MESYIQLEYQIVGSFIINESSRQFINLIEEKDFLDVKSRSVFKAIKELHNKGEDISPISINKLSGAKGSDINDIVSTVATTKTIESDVGHLKESSNKRQIREKLHKALNSINDDESFQDIKNNILGEIQELKGIEDRGVVKISEVTDKIALRVASGEKMDKGIATGIPRLNKIIGGFKKGQLITIGAETGVGKSMLAMQFGVHASVVEKKRVLFVSLEMSYEQIGYRLLSATADVNSLDVYNQSLNNDEEIRFIAAANKFMEPKLYLDNTSKKTQDIRSKLLEKEYDLLIVDYLQLISTTAKNQSREREVASISRDLKSISFDFDIPVIMLSQLNRAVNGEMPSLSNLRESGAIEHDSDIVMFIWEPEGRLLEQKINDEYSISFQQVLQQRNQSLAEIIVAKQRAGRRGKFDVIKDGRRSTFTEIDQRY